MSSQGQGLVKPEGSWPSREGLSYMKRGRQEWSKAEPEATGQMTLPGGGVSHGEPPASELASPRDGAREVSGF